MSVSKVELESALYQQYGAGRTKTQFRRDFSNMVNGYANADKVAGPDGKLMRRQLNNFYSRSK